jgi:predicted O-methyltransferase YrrM
MIRFLLLAAVCGHASVVEQAAGPYGGLPDPRIAAVLEKLSGKPGRWNISPEDGRFLYDLILRHDLKAGLEIGASNGYSGIWLGMAFRQTGGRLITIEHDQARGREALSNFKRAGVADRVDLRLDDAFRVVPNLSGPFDFVFIDAWKTDYRKYLEMILPKVRPGGYITAHNVTDQRSDVADFIRSITNDPRLKTEIVATGRSGISVTQKLKR